MDLVERDHELARMRAAVDGARRGAGSGVAVAGDAGTGKTALAAAACSASDGIRVLRGGCDPLTTPRPLGPFRDIAAEQAVPPSHQRDDAPLPLVCEALYHWLRTEPTLLVVEDLHWVDAATADVLRFLVRRIGSLPLALVVTYRDLDIGQIHSARALLGDLARSEDVETLPLRPLSRDGVAQVLAGTRLDPHQVHRTTGGNPFFVTEIAKDPQRPLPSSVRDAVLARAAGLAPGDLELVRLVATAPDRLDERVLPALGVDLAALERLAGTGLLVRARGGLAFRHELARQAVESTIPPGGSHGLHRRLLDVLETVEPCEPAVLTHHAVAARDAARAAAYARRAADDASSAGAHREAVGFLRIALDHLDDPAPGVEAELRHRLGYEQYMTSRLAEAVDNVRATFPLWRRAENLSGLSAAHEHVAVFEYYRARRHDAQRHIGEAERIALAGDVPLALGAARATAAYLAHMRSDADLAAGLAAEATALGEEHTAPALALRGRLIGASVRLGRGDETARRELFEHVDAARSSGWDELASTGYSQAAALDVEHRRLRAAEHVLDESLPFARSRDIWICEHWQTAMRSRLRFAEGRWKAAVEDAEHVLAEVGMPLARLWPHLVVALVGLRTAGSEASGDHLESAWTLARSIEEPLRLLPVLSALAEAQWLTGVDDPRVTREAPGLLSEAARAAGTGWSAGDLHGWLARLGVPAGLPPDAAVPHSLAAAGRHRDAALAWHRIGEPFAAAMALADSPDVEDRLRAVADLDGLGALATADRVRVDLRRDGVQVPSRARASTRANPGGLTNRQLDVARLVARGLTNAEIAGRLFISPKTTDHHVSAVLTKLGLTTRRAIVVRADELGLA